MLQRFLDPSVLAGISGLDLVAKTVVDGFVAGLHRSPDFGFSQEFAEYRAYSPGDDLRHVDWNVFARTERAYLKRYRGETNSMLTVLLDASNSMKFSSHSVTKMDYARFTAASLFYLAIQNQRDAAGLIVFDDEIRSYIRPSTRQGQLVRLLSGLEHAEPRARTDFAKPLHHFQQFLRRRGIVVFISDFTNPPSKSSAPSSLCAFTEMRSSCFTFSIPRKSGPISASRPRWSIWKRRSASRLLPNTFATNTAQKWARIWNRCATKRAAPAWIITCSLPTDRSTIRSGNTFRFARGGIKWVFFAPWFLAGIAAVAIPFYVHLLRRHTTTPHPFSSLMFFERRTQSSIKHRRLRYLLLLSLRTLLLLLLALVFANPFINRTAANMSNEKLLLVVIDNSFSMRAGTRLADARREALSVLSSRRPSDRAQVMALGSQIQVLTQPSQDAGALRAAVESLQPGDSHGNFGELARSLRSLAESIATPIELHLFSDMQKSQMPASFNELALPANVSLILHPMVKDPVPNWTVESVNVPGQVWEPKKTRVQVVVAGFNTPPPRRRSLCLRPERHWPRRASPCQRMAALQLNFHRSIVPYGFTRCEARIDSADAFPADDSSIFAVERTDPRRVLFVYEAGDSRSPVYFRAALASTAESGFTVDTTSTAQAAGLPLSKYAFVVFPM